MRAKNTSPVYAEIPQVLDRRLRRTVKAKGLTVAQAVRWALADWLDHGGPVRRQDGHNNDGGHDAD